MPNFAVHMITIGITQFLNIDRLTDFGLFLGDNEGNEVLLPNKYVPLVYEFNDQIEVFIYKDSEDRIVATNLIPKVEVYQYAYLQVNAVNSVGAFMDWGLEKDLLVPFREQNGQMMVGQWYVIFVYRDFASDRLVGTTKIKKSLHVESVDLQLNQKVDVMAFEETDRGMQVIVEGKYRGIIYANETYKPVFVGDIFTCYVKHIRTDLLIDLSLERIGRGKMDSSSERILNKLDKNKGYLHLSDKSDPDEIKDELQMSKKTFKMAIGTLYKKGLIIIAEDSISLKQH